MRKAKSQSTLDRIHKLHDEMKSLVQEQINHHQSEIDRLKELVGGIGDAAVGAMNKGSKAVKKWFGGGPKKTKGKKRIRRTPEQLKAEAGAIYAMIKKAGDSGISGNEIRKTYPRVGIDIKAFVKKWSKSSVKTRGIASGTTYHAA